VGFIYLVTCQVQRRALKTSPIEAQNKTRSYKRNFTTCKINYQLSHIHDGRFIKLTIFTADEYRTTQLLLFYDSNSTFIRFTKSLISIGFLMKQPTSKLGNISFNAS
jgi:hypothetical protein